MDRQRILPTTLPGCFVLSPYRHTDSRGEFVKLLDSSIGQAISPLPDWRELYYSTSKEGVVRGMHLQLPPADGAKIVTCMSGEAFDVIVDLRRNTPTYGKVYTSHLRPKAGNAVLIPPGCAHGFQALAPATTLLYMQEAAYSAQADSGVRFDSIGVEWPLPVSEVAPRDLSLEPLSAFVSPFGAF